MIDLSNSEIFKLEISYLIMNFCILLDNRDYRVVFEFFMFSGRNTHRFRRQYYKYPFWKKGLLLTVFDENLLKESKYQKQMKTIFWSNVVHKVIMLILVILRCIFTYNKNIPIWFAIVNAIFFIAYLAFGIWVKAHRAVDWRGWVKGGIHLKDFYMPLPGDDPNKKPKRDTWGI